MTNWTEADIVAHGTKLHYYRTGGRGPRIVLAHGITDDGLCWTAVANALASQYDLIMLDARGHGKSEAPDSGYDQKSMTMELASFIKVLQLEKPILLGHSMGAATALHMAGLYPEIPGAIILEDPPAFWMQEGASQQEYSRSEFIAGILALKKKTAAELIAECQSNHPTWSDEEVMPWVDSKHRFNPKIVSLIHSRRDSAEADAATLKHVVCPTLLITAAQTRGAILGDLEVDRLKAMIPQLKRIHIQEAGHNIRRDQFDDYIKVLKEHLAKVTSLS